jgi:phosphonate transport system substrate-binding protein
MGGGLVGAALLAACGSDDEPKAGGSSSSGSSAPASDLNAQGFPKSISKVTFAYIPLEDQTVQMGKLKAFHDSLNSNMGVPIEASITTSYAAVVQAQKNKLVDVGYYGALSFLLAEQQFGAVPILVDSKDGKTPGSYNSYLIAGKDSGIKTVADLKGKDFAFVDPASTSGNLFPRAMLAEENIDPAKDMKTRYAGNHDNVILAVSRGQVPAGATNNISVDNAINNGAIKKEDIVILKTSVPIPNGPYAVHPDWDKRATKKLQESAAKFTDAAALKAMQLQGPLVPVDTSLYDFVRKTAKLLNLQFDEKGGVKPVGG